MNEHKSKVEWQKKGKDPEKYEGNTFKFNRNQHCSTCIQLAEVTIVKEVEYEVIDKKENKRLYRKGQESHINDDEDETITKMVEVREKVFENDNRKLFRHMN